MIVSTIVPLYKGQKYVVKLVNMVLDALSYAQEKGLDIESELVFVNDFPSERILIPSGYNQINIIYIENQDNLGIHQSRVIGLSKAKGKYIVFLDQDDIIERDFYYQALTNVHKNDVIILNGYRELADGKKKKIYRTKGDILTLETDKVFVTNYNPIESPGHCMILKDSIPNEWKDFILHNNCSDDLFLWILMKSLNCRFSFLNKCCYTHSYTGENVSADVIKRYNSNYEMDNLLYKIDYVSQTDISYFELFRKIDNKNNSIGLLLRFKFYLYRLKYKILKIFFNKRLDDDI